MRIPRQTCSRPMLSIAALLVVSTAACGVNASEGTSEDTIKLGLIQPKTGPVAFDGESVINGAKLAERNINENGGINGKDIALVIEDGQGDPTESINAYQKLIRRDNVAAIIGAWSSSATLALKPRIAKDEIPLVVETASSPKVTDPGNEWLFRVSADLKSAAETFEPYINEDMGFTNPAYISVNNDWGLDTTEAFQNVVEAAGGAKGDEYTVEPGDVDFESILNRIAASDAEQVILTTDIRGIGTILRQRHAAGMDDMPFLITAGIPGETVQEQVGQDIDLNNVWLMNYWVPEPAPDSVAEETANFVANYAEAYPDRNVDKYAANGYDAVQVLAEAIDTADSTEPSDIRDALDQGDYELLSGAGQFSDKGQIGSRISISRFDDGELKFVRYTDE